MTNVELVRKMYDDWIGGDLDAVFGFYDPEIRLNPDPEYGWVDMDDSFEGHDGVRRYMRRVYEAFEDYRPEVEDVIDAGDDRVLTLAVEHGRGRGSGAQVASQKTAHLWTIRDGKAVQVDLFLDRERAREALAK
jgi:ketosteroid isomerase-like protein